MIYKKIFTISLLLMLAGCDAAVETLKEETCKRVDCYPPVLLGLDAVKAFNHVPGSTLAPGIMQLQVTLDCMLLAESDNFGKHSLVITPKSIVCGQFIRLLDKGELSVSYVDINIGHEVIYFQSYSSRLNEELLAGKIDPKAGKLIGNSEEEIEEGT